MCFSGCLFIKGQFFQCCLELALQLGNLRGQESVGLDILLKILFKIQFSIRNLTKFDL